MVNLFLLQVKKIGFKSSIFRVGSENSDPFYHVSLYVEESKRKGKKEDEEEVNKWIGKKRKKKRKRKK